MKYRLTNIKANPYINIGVGYTLPFKVAGAPWINADQFAKALNSQQIPGVIFHPFHYRPFFGSFKGLDCHGVKIQITDPQLYRPLIVQFTLIGTLKSLYPKIVSEKLTHMASTQKQCFNKVLGNQSMIQLIATEPQVTLKLINFQKSEREQFLKKRQSYLLY